MDNFYDWAREGGRAVVACFIRELKEELGVDGKPKSPIFRK
jgi:hypothetical protein